MEQMPQINRVFSMIMQQERKVQYGTCSIVDDESTALVNATNDTRSNGRGRCYGGTHGRG